MPIELPPQYDPKLVEKAIYQKWLDSGAFHAVPDARTNKFSVVIPPPNVTGALHLGHAINGTIQDILTRYHRMIGDNTLWMPGIDHAGIATQAVVEKSIFEKEHKSRHDLGRDELVRRIWQWKEQFGTRILAQLQSIGSSCDWDRTRFTLDDICAKAVREAFFKMFKDGLIFRGKRLVNWDTHLQTAVADDEIYHEEVKGQMTSIKYPVASEPRPSGSDQLGNIPQGSLPDGRGSEVEYLIVATTRPETMLGDTAVAVHPDDPRYKHLIGQHVIVPLVGRKIPIIADGQLVDPKFGTGVVKVTPAHDPNDYATGIRHNLEQINLLTPDGKVNENGQGEFLGKKYSYTGLKFATAARKQVLADLEELNLIADKKPHEHEVGHSDRSKTPIEPYLSDQWFVRMGDIISEPRPSGSDQSEPRPSGSDQSEPRPLGSDQNASPSEGQPQTHIPALPPHSTALAYFITFHTFATWLHGQEPGAVDPEHNDYGTPFIPPNPKLWELKLSKAAQPPLELSVAQRQSVLNTLQEVATFRGWTIHAINVRSTHVHIVVSGNHAPERMMNDFKSYATRRMVETALLPKDTKAWSRHGSTRYLWKPEHLSGAVHYTLHQQGENASGTTSSKTEPRPSGSDQSHNIPPGSLPHGRGSESHSPSGVTLADGTRAPGLAQAAIDAVTSGRVKITPERYAKGYIDWLSQKRDWCISRQLWWGHRIPVWHARYEIAPNTPQYANAILDLDELYGMRDANGELYAIAQIVNVETGEVVHPEESATHAAILASGGTFDVYMATKNPELFEQEFGQANYIQDPDVLDTWFSSALWPISTMGWPNSEPRPSGSDHATPTEGSLPHGRGSDGMIPEPTLLPYFYPTSLLSTAREILTLWVARMVIFGLYCQGDIPFKDVYIHAIIQDGNGQPMKKTLGNGVDPVDIVQSHGADALRFTLASMATETQDIRLPVQLVCPHCQERLPNNINGPVVIGCPKCKKQMTRPVQTAVATADAPMSHSTSDRFDLGRNFANKIWNASRFILGNLTGTPDGNPGLLALEDRWILSKLNTILEQSTAAINNYRFAELAQSLYHFFWSDLCDWYLEIAKSRIKSGDAAVQQVLLHCLETALKLLHPIMPFITEEIWSNLPNRQSMLITAPWPKLDKSKLDSDANDQIGLLQYLITEIRNTQNNYPAAKGKPAIFQPQDAGVRDLIESSRHIIESLANIKIAKNELMAAKPENAAVIVLPGRIQIFIPGVIDKATETAKLTKRQAELEKLIAGSEGKLANEAFTSKAPPKIIQGLRDQLAKYQEELAAIVKNLSEL